MRNLIKLNLVMSILFTTCLFSEAAISAPTNSTIKVTRLAVSSAEIYGPLGRIQSRESPTIDEKAIGTTIGKASTMGTESLPPSQKRERVTSPYGSRPSTSTSIPQPSSGGPGPSTK